MDIQSKYHRLLDQEDQRELPFGQKCQIVKNDETQIYAARWVSFYPHKFMKSNQNTLESYIKIKRKNCSHILYNMCIEYNNWNFAALLERLWHLVVLRKTTYPSGAKATSYVPYQNFREN